MRISDWSSDVCSSDLQGIHRRARRGRQLQLQHVPLYGAQHAGKAVFKPARPDAADRDRRGHAAEGAEAARADAGDVRRHGGAGRCGQAEGDRWLTFPCRASTWTHSFETRSEEHTSELQSLMRISYAVFCLKNKNIKPTQ